MERPRENWKRAFEVAQKEAGCGGENLREKISRANYERAHEIAALSTRTTGKPWLWQQKLDSIVTGIYSGIPLMILLLALVFWLTIDAANLPSRALSNILLGFETHLNRFLLFLPLGARIRLFLVEGVYRTVAWVVSVMLVPMAIFFPLFALLEDSGYLARMAFNLDRLFRGAGANGKQAFTMCMGFGCNAVGVVACRIIESPRERLLAVLTNGFVPCNGKFPTIIALATIFFGYSSASTPSQTASVLAVITLITLGFGATLLVSYILSNTILRGLSSSFILELPPYRRPRIAHVLVRSVFDRTSRVLVRAVIMAAGAGALIWVLANNHMHEISLLQTMAAALEPAGKLLGMDGVILLAFVLGLPANEIVLPVMIMTYLSRSTLTDAQSLAGLHGLLVANGWTRMTAVCTMLFTLFHFPCSTTLWTVKKETGSWPNTLWAALIPTATGVILLLILRVASCLHSAWSAGLRFS